MVLQLVRVPERLLWLRPICGRQTPDAIDVEEVGAEKEENTPKTLAKSMMGELVGVNCDFAATIEIEVSFCVTAFRGVEKNEDAAARFQVPPRGDMMVVY